MGAKVGHEKFLFQALIVNHGYLTELMSWRICRKVISMFHALKYVL